MLDSVFENILRHAAISRVAALLVAAGCLALVCTSQIKAQTTLNFNHTSTFSGTAPSGSLSATFTDQTGPTCGGGCVQLVITSHLASATPTKSAENLDPGKALYLNFDPSDSLSDLAGFTLKSYTGGFSQAASVLVSENNYKADGTGGYFDILFTYTPSTKAFVGGTSQTYLITGNSPSDPITASDFTTFYSAAGKSGGAGPYIAAIHVQEPTSSGWVSGDMSATPEPASMLLFGTGLFAIGGILRRRKANSVPAIS